MIILLLFTLVIFGLYLIVLLYIPYRNNKVYLYRDCLIDRIYDSPYYEELLIEFRQVSYSKMVCIPKPLKDEYWFSKEFIELLNKK